jgi:hypothetical protein
VASYETTFGTPFDIYTEGRNILDRAPEASRVTCPTAPEPLRTQRKQDIPKGQRSKAHPVSMAWPPFGHATLKASHQADDVAGGIPPPSQDQTRTK